MYKGLTEKVYYGDKPALTEARFQSIINVAHSIRKPYWDNVGKLDWDVWYFRLACPDRTEPGIVYMKAMEKVLDAIRIAGKFPLLCHCRMGGHRGPTAALFAAWHLGGRTKSLLGDLTAEMVRRNPKFLKRQEIRVYRRCMLDYCNECCRR